MKLENLRGLIVSIQPEPQSVLSEPHIVAELAACAMANGATGVRIESTQCIAAVRKRCPATPLVGLIKRSSGGFAPYITPALSDVKEVLDAGAGIVAFDATPRARPDGSTVADAVREIHGRDAIAFADCSTLDDARAALDAGADVVSTTLCGYTDETRNVTLPALDLVARVKALGAPFAVCEGGIVTTEQVARAFASGADAVVIGTALTNLDLRIRSFAQAARARR